MLTKKLLFPAVFALATAFSMGCQTTAVEAPSNPLAELEAAVAEVRSIAEEALRTANSASYDAGTAKDMAFSAAEAAGDAQACCDANSDRMSRMFDDSMSSK